MLCYAMLCYAMLCYTVTAQGHPHLAERWDGSREDERGRLFRRRRAEPRSSLQALSVEVNIR